VLAEDLDDKLKQIIIDFLVVLYFWMLRFIKRKLTTLLLIIEMVILDDYDIFTLFDVQFLHCLC
jgi:hypothetical protein